MEQNKRQEKLVDDLLNGKATLYSMSDIQNKLSISRSTLNRWIKNGESRPTTPESRRDPFNELSKIFLSMEDEEDSTTIFPPPDLYIGSSPRWAKETVKKWILDNQKNK